MLFKIVNKLIPHYLGEKLPPLRFPFSDDPITIFREFRPRTERFAKSFFPDAIKLWNTLMPYFSEMPTLSELKNHLLSLFHPTKKSIFNVYDPVGTKILFQLRLCLSKLRNHKKIHKIREDYMEEK